MTGPSAATEPRRPIRVLHVFHELRHSGGESMMHTARDLWIEQGIDCELVAVGETVGDFAPDLAARGYRIHHLRPTRWALMSGFFTLVRRRRPDIVHIHTERAGFWLALVSRLLGSRVVQSVHSMFPFTGALRRERRVQRRIARRLGVRFVAVSPDVAEHERSQFANSAEIIRNWIDLDRFAPATPAERESARRSLDLSADDFVVLTVGNCWTMKNHALVVEAMGHSAIPARAVYLHAGDHSVGTGTDEQAMAERSSRSAAIRFLGTRDDVPRLLHACDVFVMPSSYEGSGLAAIEAMATDTPVVVGDSPGLRDLHRLDPSVRLVTLDAEAIATAIAQVDHGARSGTLEVHGREIALRWFGPNVGTSNYAALYSRVLPRRRRAVGR